jgi:hypothetical protein
MFKVHGQHNKAAQNHGATVKVIATGHINGLLMARFT